MDKRKWRNPKMPLEMLALKLQEELGEVSLEITDAFCARKDVLTNAKRRKRLDTELSHVEFLAGEMRKRLREAKAK